MPVRPLRFGRQSRFTRTVNGPALILGQAHLLFGAHRVSGRYLLGRAPAEVFVQSVVVF